MCSRGKWRVTFSSVLSSEPRADKRFQTMKTAPKSSGKNNMFARGYEFTPVCGQHICVSFFKKPYAAVWTESSFCLWGRGRGRGGSSSGLRSNFHDVWMCSLTPLINNQFPALTIRRRGYWLRPQVTDLLPQKRPDALAALWARMQTSWHWNKILG